jgi:uncharacterized membrane protein (DUF441 family)
MQSAQQVPIASGDYKAANPTAVQLDTENAVSLRVGVNISAISGAGAQLVVNIEGYDKGSDSWYSLLASAALNATGFTPLVVDPRIAAVANSVAQQPLPTQVRIRPVKGGTTSTLSYSISADLTQ